MTGILKYKNHLLPGGQFRNPFDSRIFAELKKPGNGLKSQQVLGKRFMSSFNHQHPGEHYDNLELPSISSGGGSLIPRKRIKEQFQRLALKWHPDRNQDPDAKEKFAKISGSYRLLMDTEKRREYDRWLNNIRTDRELTFGGNASSVSSSDPSDIFKQRAQDPNFTDFKAADFANVRYRTASKEYKDFLKSQQRQRQNVNSTASVHNDPMWDRYQEKLKDEHQRVQIRRMINADDQVSLTVSIVTVLACFIFGYRYMVEKSIDSYDGKSSR